LSDAAHRHLCVTARSQQQTGGVTGGKCCAFGARWCWKWSGCAIKSPCWSAAELVAHASVVEGVSAKSAARVYIRRAFSWGSLLLTARPGGEIRTPNLRLMFDVTGFRASAWETKETAEIKQSRISGEQILSSCAFSKLGPREK
jgi:hypothetical protein